MHKEEMNESGIEGIKLLKNIGGCFMGFAKLNVWFRDTQGRAIVNEVQTQAWDWVGVWRVGEYKQGTGTGIGPGAIVQQNIPKGLAHVQVEVPPGAYIVQGHFCDPELEGRNLSNNYTDRAMVIANCDQEICVNLLVPQFGECVRSIVDAAHDAIRVRPELLPHLPVVLSTLLDAADIRINEVVREADMHLKLAKELKVDKQKVSAQQFINTLTALK